MNKNSERREREVKRGLKCIGMGHGAHYNTTKEKLAEFQAHRTTNCIQVEEGQWRRGGTLGREDEMI